MDQQEQQVSGGPPVLLTAGSGALAAVLEQAGHAAPAARLGPAALRRRPLQGRQRAGQGRLQHHRPAVGQRCRGRRESARN